MTYGTKGTNETKKQISEQIKSARVEVKQKQAQLKALKKLQGKLDREKRKLAQIDEQLERY